MVNIKTLEDRIARLEQVAANKENPLQVEHWFVSPAREDIDEDGNVMVVPSSEWLFQRFTANQPHSLEYMVTA